MPQQFPNRLEIVPKPTAGLLLMDLARGSGHRVEDSLGDQLQLLSAAFGNSLEMILRAANFVKARTGQVTGESVKRLISDLGIGGDKVWHLFGCSIVLSELSPLLCACWCAGSWDVWVMFGRRRRVD